jgi:hypothetical protein
MSQNAPTGRESLVLDLYDGGLDSAAIAAKLELDPVYVVNVVNRYGSTAGSDRAWNGMVALGSARLLAALRRYHPEGRP